MADVLQLAIIDDYVALRSVSMDDDGIPSYKCLVVLDGADSSEAVDTDSKIDTNVIKLEGNTIVINDNSLFKSNATTIVLKKPTLDTSTGKISGVTEYTGSDYTLAVGDDLASERKDSTRTLEENWTVDTTVKTQANNTAKVDGVYALSEDAKTLYKSVTYDVKITGLKEGFSASNLTKTDVITVPADGLGDTDINVTATISSANDKADVSETLYYELQPGDSKATVTYSWEQKKGKTEATLSRTVSGSANTYYSEGATIKKLASATSANDATAVLTLKGLPKVKEAVTSTGSVSSAGITGYTGITVTQLPNGNVPGVVTVDSGLLTGDSDDGLVKVDKSGAGTAIYGLKKLEIGSGSFTLALDETDEDIPVQETVTEEDIKWVVDKSGKARLVGGTTAGYALSSDGKTLEYKTASYTTIYATITGLGKGLDDDDIEALEEALKEVTVLPQEAVATTYREATSSEITAYKANTGTLTFYTVSGTGDDATYTAFTGTIADGDTTKYYVVAVEGQDAKAGIIALNSDVLANVDTSKVKVALGKNDDYVFSFSAVEISDDVVVGGLDDSKIYHIDGTKTGTWTVDTKTKGDKVTYTGKATYTGTTVAGFTLASDAKSVGYCASTEAEVTLSGLNKDKLAALAEQESAENINTAIGEYLVAEGQSIVLTKPSADAENIFDSKVSIKNAKGVNLMLEAGEYLSPQNATEGTWAVDAKKGTATYYTGKSSGYVVDAKKGTTATFTTPTISDDDIIASIKSLPKTVTADDISFAYAKEQKSETVDVGSGVTVTKLVYTKSDGTEVSYTETEYDALNDDDKAALTPVYEKVQKTETAEEGGVTVTKLVYTDASGTEVSYTETEYDALNDDDKAALTPVYEVDEKTFALSANVFKNAKDGYTVTLDSGSDAGYKLTVAEGLNTDDTAQETWTIAKGKAILTNSTPEYYEVATDGKTVKYHAIPKTAKAIATVSGLNKDATTGVTSSGTVITVDKSAIDTSKGDEKVKVALKVDKSATETYTLALGSGFTEASTAYDWDTSKTGKALYQLKVTGAGYVSDGTTITYGTIDTKKTKPLTLATVSGVTGAPKDPDINGIIVVDGVVDLEKGKKVSLGKKDVGYSLVLHAGKNAQVLKEGSEWSGTVDETSLEATFTLKGGKTVGYEMKDGVLNVVKAAKIDKKTSKPKETGVVATISGTFANKDVKMTDLSADTQVITVDPTKINATKELTADGKGVLGFNFGAYSGTTTDGVTTNATVTGSASNDTFTFSGSSGALTIDAKKGNDYVVFGSRTDEAKANTFVYETGDGYDEVADFTTGDYLSVTGKEINVTASNGNTYVNVDNKGVITLDDFEYSGITFTDTAANLIAPEFDFSTKTEEHDPITEITLSETKTMTYADEFTLKATGDSNFTATISFTKKTAGTTPTPSGGD